MVLSDKDIKKALKEKKLLIEPEPEDIQIDSTTIDLHIGEPFWMWDPILVKQAGVNVTLNIDNINFSEFAEPYLKMVEKDSNGSYKIEQEMEP